MAAIAGSVGSVVSADDSHERKPLVCVRDVRKSYPGSSQPAVDGISFVLHPGEAVGLLGPNGAGKTTLISMICSLLFPDDGEITTSDEPGASDRSLLGLVPQHIALYPALTILENLRFFGRLEGLSGESLNERIEYAVEWMGLEKAVMKRVCRCSGGVRRRANLAVGLLGNPRLLVLDEPTVGIDAQSRSVILRRLRALPDRDTSLLYSTHYMEAVGTVCSRILVMDEGRVIADGSAETLIARTNGECRNLEELFLHLTGRRLRD